tara:strand:+ start:169 stop:777 length:609 start_codon:yes stop_codon:yes gene_type:complete
MFRSLKNNAGFSLTEVMVSVFMISVLAAMNLTMFSENIRSQKVATETAASARTFQTMLSLLADPDVCDRFLGDDNPDFGGDGQALPTQYTSGSDDRILINKDRVIRIPNGDIIMFQTAESAIAAEPKIFEDHIAIGSMWLETYRRNATTGAETVKFAVDFVSSHVDSYLSQQNQHFSQEGTLLITSIDDAGTRRITGCSAAE